MGASLRDRLNEIKAEVSQAINDGARIIVLSDRDGDAERRTNSFITFNLSGPPPLIREKTRTKVGW